MLKFKFILNTLVCSFDNAIQRDTLVSPYYKSDESKKIKTFDFIVDNPLFKMDFRDTKNEIESQKINF